MALHNRYKPVLPEYVRYMANDSLFGTKEIGEVFGYSKNSIKHGMVKTLLVDKGYLPDPSKLKKIYGSGRPLNKWTKLEIVEAVYKYNKEFFGE